jgi:hypothetical protein
MKTPSLAAGLVTLKWFCSRVCQVPGVLLYLSSRRGKLKEKSLHATRQETGRAAEGQRSRMQLTKRQAAERFTRLVGAKN